MTAISRRAFLSGTACAAVLAGGPAFALEIADVPGWGAGHVGLAADMAWWDPCGESERARLPLLPASQPVTTEMLDWHLA